jgi:hypothetical protein
VPKPLNENIDGPVSSLVACAPMEMRSIAMRMKGSALLRERRARKRSRRVDCIDMSHFRIKQERDVRAYRLESIDAVRQPAERLWGKTPHQALNTAGCAL